MLPQEYLAEVFGIAPLEAAIRMSTLTAREAQITALLAHGFYGPDIERALHITARTMRRHVMRIKRKLIVTRVGIARIYFASKMAVAPATHGAVSPGVGVDARDDAITHHTDVALESQMSAVTN